MPMADQKTITERLKKGVLDNIYYIYGQNVTGVQTVTKQIIRTAVGDNEEFALTRLDGKKLDFS
ncbi:MAG: DNA polymerase III subunit delta, partial [Ruminococcus sp.]|nr:DNA polymerase III subunit delta [Ruminococcus sp.]